MDMNLEYTNRQAFLMGQIKLYKLEYISRDTEEYLEVMHELSKTAAFIELSRDMIHKMSKEIQELKTENTKIKKLIDEK